MTSLNDIFYLNFAPIFKKVYLYQKVYNPKKKPIYINDQSERECDARWKLITNFLKKRKIKFGSYLDIGSQIGYFVFKMSELGFLSTGIEMNYNSVKYARTLANISKVSAVSFAHFELTSKNSYKLPQYDVISLLSVFHHLLYFQGVGNTNKIMKNIAQSTGKLLFFESGHPEEIGFYWSEIVKKVFGTNYDTWVKKYFLSLGFKDVQKIGETGTHLNSIKRSLFVAIK